MGGGGGGGTPGGATNTIQFNNAGTFSGSNNFTIIGGNFVYLTGSLLVTGSSQFLGPITGSSFTGSFTGSLFGTSSWAVSSSRAISSSYSFNATSASYAATSSYAQNIIISGSINNVDYIDFNTASAVPAWKSGRIFWDNTESSLAVYNEEADITLQVGQENWTRIFNDTGVTIANGAPVKIVGTHGDHPEVVLAQSVQVSGSVTLTSQILGLATHTIETGTFGYITTLGLVRGLNTNAFNDGDTLYVSSSAGKLTNIPPVAPYELIPVAQVVKASPGASGILYVAPQQPLDFSDLSSAYVTGSYSGGDLWVYNGPQKRWEHTNQLTGSYALTGSLNITGSIISTFITASSFTGSFTGSLFGTSSWAASASNANSSSTVYIASNGGTDANYTLVFKNSAGALDNYYQLAADGTNGPYYNPSTNVLGGTGGITVSGSVGRFNTITGSVSITGSLTGSLLGTASFATTASYALSAATFPYTGSAQITGSLGVTGSINQMDSSAVFPMSQEVIYLVGSIGIGTTPVISKALAGPASMFMDYQIVDLATGTNQRTGTIIANFNNAGTPTSTYNEIVTGDIGNTSAISFITATPAGYEIQAVNSGLSAYTFKGTLRYF